MGRLTALQIQRAMPGSKLSDGGGLVGRKNRNGSMSWYLRIMVKGKRSDVPLPVVSGAITNRRAADSTLKEARGAAFDMRRAIKAGASIDIVRRNTQRAPTFAEVAEMVHKEHRPSWRNSRHAQQWITSLERHAYPALGNLPVDQIDAPAIRDALIVIWLTIPETARRVRQRIGTVLDFAHAKGWREAEAPMRSVTRGLPKQAKTERHLDALPWSDVPDFVDRLSEILRSETLRLLCEFTILTAVRSGEARGARWSEVDFETNTWTIPSNRMKGGRPHRVPLSSRALEILSRMRKLRRSDAEDAAIFEGRNPGEPLADMSLLRALKRAGFKNTLHGFRSSFRDWCAEAANVPREIAEACLAHKVGGVEGAYARTDHLGKRRDVMDAWGAYCLRDQTSETVIPLRARRA